MEYYVSFYEKASKKKIKNRRNTRKRDSKTQNLQKSGCQPSAPFFCYSSATWMPSRRPSTTSSSPVHRRKMSLTSSVVVSKWLVAS